MVGFGSGAKEWYLVRGRFEVRCPNVGNEEFDMSARVEIPFPPRPGEPRSGHVEPLFVPLEPRWEYKELVRDRQAEGLPSEADLNDLGREHWELAGVVSEGERVHFYFKRERAR